MNFRMKSKTGESGKIIFPFTTLFIIVAIVIYMLFFGGPDVDKVPEWGEQEGEKVAPAVRFKTLGIIKWLDGDYKSAEDMFRKGIDADPDLSENYGMLAQCYLDMGKENYDEIISLAETAIRLTDIPLDIAIEQGRLARAYAMKGDCNRANEYISLYDNVTREEGFLKQERNYENKSNHTE